MRTILTNGTVLVQRDGKTENLQLIVEDDGTVRALSAEQIAERREGNPQPE